MPREKSRYRERRSLSLSSDSSYDRKKSKSKHKRRSHSRDRSESSSHRRKRSVSRSKPKKRSYSRSESRERHENKIRHRSSSRCRSKRSKYSRDRSRSTSRDRNKYYKSTKKISSKRSNTRSRSNSFDIEPKLKNKTNLDDTNTKVEKAIKAAEAAGLTMTKLPTYDYKEVEVKEEMPTIHDRNLLDEINCESFVQKSFTSSKSKKQTQNIVIDLNSETVKIPENEVKLKRDDCIINFELIPSPEELKEMWIKKLYQYRKKMLKGEIS